MNQCRTSVRPSERVAVAESPSKRQPTPPTPKRSEEKERAQTEELEECRKKTKAAHDAFERVKSERASTFMAAYKHISDAIDKVYKELTMSPSHPLGGTAYSRWRASRSRTTQG